MTISGYSPAPGAGSCAPTSSGPALLLASNSATRKDMLRNAGVPFEVTSAPVDERALEAAMAGKAPEAIALALAEAKAKAGAATVADDAARSSLPVLGGDSLVVVNGRRFDKPRSLAEAAEHLRFFSGQVMELHSAAVIVQNGETVWQHAALAKLYIRPLSEGFIASYLEAEWPEVSYCVGVFRIEALGVNLFDRVEGDYFTILGMPLLAVLGGLRNLGILPQ